MAAMSDVNAVATAPEHGDDDDDELDWEEWDGRSPFVHHCLAGSVAGIAEHTLLYPVDTVKTHMQSYCADCPYNNSTAATGTGTAGNANPSTMMRGASSKAAKAAAAAAVHPVRGQVPGAVHMAGTTTSAGSTAASAAAAVAPPHPRQGAHGMWRTMTNIVYSGSGQGYHGPLHQFEPRIGSSSSSLAVLNRGAAAAKCAAEELAAKGAGAAAATTGGEASVMRLFRGVQTMLVGCAPAHALYFSSYEIVKALFLAAENPGHPATPAPLLLPLTTSTDIEATSSAIVEAPHLSPLGSASAGAVATVMHDAVMTPLDTIKQRLQLGHYSGSMTAAARSIVNTEGWAGLYRSLPVTLAANVPYGAVMVSTNEFLKYTLNPEGTFDIKTYVAAGCGAGMVAAATTTPLDRVKTRLQTQRMGSAMELAAAASERAAMEVSPRCDHIPYGPRCGKAQAEAMIVNGGGRARYAGVGDALRSIVREEGYVGLFRGLTPRVLMHTPAVAISWTTYESAKKWLADNFPQ